LVSIWEHCNKRREGGEELIKISQDFSFDPKLDEKGFKVLMLQIKKIFKQDTEFLNTQIALYKKDLEGSSTKMADVHKRVEQ